MLDAQKQLQEADRAITGWRNTIARQKRRIAEMQKGGYSAAGSIMLLREMEASLNSMRRDRDAIARRIEWHQRLIRATELARSA
jgi:hypothetical protein